MENALLATLQNTLLSKFEYYVSMSEKCKNLQVFSQKPFSNGYSGHVDFDNPIEKVWPTVQNFLAEGQHKILVSKVFLQNVPLDT